MSQFLLCKTSSDLSNQGGIKVSECPGGQRALMRVVREYFPDDEGEDIWFIENIDSLFTKAREEVYDRAFEKTELYTLLQELYDVSERLVLWYSDDYQVLDSAATKEDFFNIVEKGIKTPTCEHYIYLQK